MQDFDGGNHTDGFYEDQRWWGGNVKHR